MLRLLLDCLLFLAVGCSHLHVILSFGLSRMETLICFAESQHSPLESTQDHCAAYSHQTQTK